MRAALERLRDHCHRADLFADAVRLADAALAEQSAQGDPKPSAPEFRVICTKCRRDIGLCDCAFNSDAHAGRCTKRVPVARPTAPAPIEQPAQGKPERSNRQFLTPEWIAAEDAAGGVLTAGALASTLPPAPSVPPGTVLLPKVLTPAMQRVVEADEWEWADLLAAAGAVTEAEHAEILNAPPATSVPDDDIDAVLAAAAKAYADKHAIAAVGDVVETTWGTWKRPQKVRITSVGAHLVCRYDDLAKDWAVGFAMNYTAHRLMKDGTLKERSEGHGIYLSNLQTDDGRTWFRNGRWNQEEGFNHGGLSWSTSRERRKAMLASAPEPPRG